MLALELPPVTVGGLTRRWNGPTSPAAHRQSVSHRLGRMTLERSTVEALVTKAVSLLVSEQPELLALDVTERALSHHLACYLSRSAPPGFDVDIEYNRHFAEPKRLVLPPRRALDRELRATTVFP